MNENENMPKEGEINPAPEQQEESKSSPHKTEQPIEQGQGKASLWCEIIVIAAGELVVNLLTLFVYMALHLSGVLESVRYPSVIAGALLGTAVTVINFLILTVNINKAINKYLALRGSRQMDDEEAEKFAGENSMVIQNAMTRSYIIRSLLMLGVLVGAFLLDWFDVIATLVPLVCYRPIIYLSELIKKNRRK